MNKRLGIARAVYGLLKDILQSAHKTTGAEVSFGLPEFIEVDGEIFRREILDQTASPSEEC